MADQTLAVNGIGDNVRVLREKTDDTNVRVSTVSQEIEALRQAIASTAGAAAAAPPAGRRAQAGRRRGAAHCRPRRRRPTRCRQRVAAADVRQVLDDYTAGRFDLAIQGFQGFIQAFPRIDQGGGRAVVTSATRVPAEKWTKRATRSRR